MAIDITKDYFKVDIELPKGNYDSLDEYISVFKKECLIYLLGYELYSLVMEAAALEAPAVPAVPGDPGTPEIPAVEIPEPYKSFIKGAEYTVNGHKIKWEGLVNAEKRSLIAYYIYCEYRRNTVTSTQVVGETIGVAENSRQANVFAKLFNAWNKFEELYGYAGQDELAPSAYNYLLTNQSDFPEWVFTELKGSINSHDL